jgi:hypothetical protein
MNDLEKIELAFDILENADLIEEFEDSVFIKVNKEQWEALWQSQN